jgi:LPS sulfotransferase NodH
VAGDPRVRCYVVCATQRSGSTLLCELLKATGVAGRPEEYFEAQSDTGAPPHPGRFLEGAPRTGLGIRDDLTPPVAPAYSSLEGITDYREHLERTWVAGSTDNGVFAAKLMFNQLRELRALAGALPAYSGLDEGELLAALFSDPTYIWVTRRDKVRQAVSLWKALQNRRWRGGEEGGRAQLQYRYDGIDHLVSLFEADDAGWRAHFSRYGITPLEIGYEDDLTRDPESTVRAALDWIGVSAPPGWRLDAPMVRQADALSEEWVASYHRDHAQHGSATADRSAASSL